MKSLRVMVLVHYQLVPPDTLKGLSEAEAYDIKTEFDVVDTLRRIGHDVHVLGVGDEIRPIRHAVTEHKPDVVFNLLEEFDGNTAFDHHVVSYLELLGVAYTGCNPRGLVISRDKALSKKLFAYHRIPTPKFAVIRTGRKVKVPKALSYPLIVKSQIEESSLGIAKASVVGDEEQLIERVRIIHERVKTDALVEEFVEGREVYAGLIGNHRLTVLPPQELVISGLAEGEFLIATEKVKHDRGYQERHGVDIKLFDGPPELLRTLERLAKRVFRVLQLSGYARVDFRLDADGMPFVLEANPNPEIARSEEVSTSAEAAGLSYEELIQRIVNLAMQRAVR